MIGGRRNPTCSRCKKKLTKVNWAPYERKRGRYKCISCYNTTAARRERFQRVRIKLAVLRLYGGKCQCCGETGYEFLTVDHVNNDGAAHRKELTGDPRGNAGFNSWKFLYNKPKSSRFQILCFNCNCAKGFYGSCPHKAINPLLKDFFLKAKKGSFSLLSKEDRDMILNDNRFLRPKPKRFK